MTPLYKITYQYQNKIRSIYVKDESFNITGSVKYRPAKYIIDKAYENKEINKETTIIEVTSGNMGIALANAAKKYGNNVIIYMPKNMSKERMKMIKDSGAKLVLTSSFDEAFALANKTKGYYVKQFENPYNAESYTNFIKEIEIKLNNFPSFIAGVGTSGTLTGSGKYLKNKYQTKIIAVEPQESLILSTGINHGEHEIQGLSDGFIPKLYQKGLVDRVISIKSLDAIIMSQKLMNKFNLHIGISSGANFLGAVLSDINGGITLFPDHSNRYYSTLLFKDGLKSKLVDQITLLNLEVL